jgi:hypothetical protein
MKSARLTKLRVHNANKKHRTAAQDHRDALDGENIVGMTT